MFLITSQRWISKLWKLNRWMIGLVNSEKLRHYFGPGRRSFYICMGENLRPIGVDHLFLEFLVKVHGTWKWYIQTWNFLCSTDLVWFGFVRVSKGFLALRRLRTNLYISYFIFCIVCLLAQDKLVLKPRLDSLSFHLLTHCFAKSMFSEVKN